MPTQPPMGRQRTGGYMDVIEENDVDYVAQIQEMDRMLSNAMFISQRLIEQQSQLRVCCHAVEANKRTWYFKRKSLSRTMLKAALTCGAMRRQTDLLHRMNLHQYRYALQEWTEVSLEVYLNSDAIYYQLKQQIASLDQLESISTASKLSLKECMEQCVEGKAIPTSQVEHCLSKDRHFQKQKFIHQLTKLVYKLGTDTTPCPDQVKVIQNQMATYLATRFDISKPISEEIAHRYISMRVGILTRPKYSNQHSECFNPIPSLFSVDS